jgi:hypothetical protein
MAGEIICFKAHCAIKRGERYCDQIAPRRVPAGRRLNDHSPSFLGQAKVAPDNVSPEVLGQARAGITKACRILKPWACSEANSELDGYPQPQRDDERLERMYRELNLDV